MRNPMVLIDWWTLVNAIILLVGVISAVFTIKKRKNRDNDGENKNSYNGSLELVGK
jgi:heme/copper-type cytochrome/quinol oxidase subunit 2